MTQTVQPAPRSAKRLAVAIPSRILYRGLLSAEAVIHDLAFTGFRAECAAALTSGARISIDLPPFGLVPARVAWCRDGQVGGLFDAAVDIRRCALRPGEAPLVRADPGPPFRR